jgi:phosphonopyruvate decarboxylase
MTYINPANEAHALALASGFYLGTGRVPVVFLQNSGLGNIINPLTSLNQIYKIPAFLLITWRGADGPGADAPEHDIMGRDMEDYLRVCRLPYRILSAEDFQQDVTELVRIAVADQVPVAAIITRDFFTSGGSHPIESGNGFTRYQAIEIIKESLGDYTFLSTTGYISRESFDIRDSPDFYMLGSMGLLSAIGCGLALGREDARIAVLDGDGAILMHLGLLPFIGSQQPRNLMHFVLDNGVNASTGNQPTIAPSARLDTIALGSGYQQAHRVTSAEELRHLLKSTEELECPCLIWVKVIPGNQQGIGRVTYSPEDIKMRFMESL